MKAIAFNGSPRKSGNTFKMLSTVLGELQQRDIDTELIHIGVRDFHGCMGCGQCRKNGQSRCIYNDDMLNSCIEKIIEADAFIIGSPVYFGNMTAQMKAFIDRVGYATRAEKLLKGKLGASVVVHRRDGALATFNAMNNLFTISECIVVGSSYWNQGVGKASGDADTDEEGIATMKTLGQNMADLLIRLNS
jgi:multimeric flavodoxin WrbA